MKKLFLTSAVLLVALLAQAQTKIAPKLENGFKAVYTDVSTVSIPGQSELKVTSETEYAVSDVTADGAVITATTTSVESDAAPTDITAQMLVLNGKMTQGIGVKLSTDATGQVKGILNLDEVKTKATEAVQTLTKALFEASPELGQMIPQEGLAEQLLSTLNEESLIASFTKSGVLALNGKTMANGAQEGFTNEQGMKLKRMYFVAGQKIIVNSTLDMTKDELKAMIIQQVEASAPEQAEMIKQNIEMVMGQMKFDLTEKDTYELQENGWVKSINSTISQDIMGQQMKGTSVITLK